MEIPPRTAEIFEILSSGKFICSNSTKDSIRELYSIMEEKENLENLYNYFKSINFILEKGDEYFYFSRMESKVDLERKIEVAFKWIDIIDFLKIFNNSFGYGYRFTPSEIVARIKIDAELETKLERLKKYTDKYKHSEIVDKILGMLIKDGFIELEDEISQTYKVLSSFKYLEQLILIINISDEIKNEGPK